MAIAHPDIFTISAVQSYKNQFTIQIDDGRQWKLSEDDFWQKRNLLPLPNHSNAEELFWRIDNRFPIDSQNCLFSLSHRVRILYDATKNQYTLEDLNCPLQEKRYVKALALTCEGRVAVIDTPHVLDLGFEKGTFELVKLDPARSRRNQACFPHKLKRAIDQATLLTISVMWVAIITLALAKGFQRIFETATSN